MWNPFTRRNESDGISIEMPPEVIAGGTSDESAATATATTAINAGTFRDATSGPIAEVNVIGQIAVATFTVTELSQDEGAERLSDLLLELGETGASNFVLDVQNVQFMDTTCLGCLVEALNRLAREGGQIALASPNHSVHYVFRLTRLDRVFRICANVPAAMKLLEGGDD